MTKQSFYPKTDGLDKGLFDQSVKGELSLYLFPTIRDLFYGIPPKDSYKLRMLKIELSVMIYAAEKAEKSIDEELSYLRDEDVDCLLDELIGFYGESISPAVANFRKERENLERVIKGQLRAEQIVFLRSSGDWKGDWRDQGVSLDSAFDYLTELVDEFG